MLNPYSSKVIAVEMTYDQLHTGELRGTSQADYLIALDARFRVIDNDLAVYDEPGFPVVELAWSFIAWLDDPGRDDFEFDSMSYDEIGTVAIRKDNEGWTVRFAHFPHAPYEHYDWTEIERCCRAFLSRVERDLRMLNIDPREALRHA